MIIDGKAISASILHNLKEQVKELPFRPVFCDVLVGDDSVSASYVGIKARTAEKVGIEFRSANFPSNISAESLIKEIKTISQENNMCGLIVQLPLPEDLPRQEVLDSVSPEIDVDCITSRNLEKFYNNKPYLIPPTAAAIWAILEALNLNLTEKQFLVLGQGELVGRPVASLLRSRGFAVNVADNTTSNTSELMKMADVIVSAVGKPSLVTGAGIKPGCVVIDAGTSESGAGIVGDADLNSVRSVALAVSPVPGGVGPVTVAMLLGNIVTVAKNKF